jgi:hypothetical protein
VSSESDRSDEPRESATGSRASPLRVFINYRRDDTAGDARALYNELAARYGGESVFLDVVTLQPGTKWLAEIKSRGSSSGAFIALIGPRWMEIMSDRGHARVVAPAEDYVKVEIEDALRRGSGVTVFPVLIDDAEVPTTAKLPRSLAPLAAIEIVRLRHTRWDDDVEHLIEQIDNVGRTPAPEPPSTKPPRKRMPEPPGEPDQVAPRPDWSHYDDVLRHVVNQGTVVPILGSGVNAGDRDEGWEDGSGALPDAEELAANLARRFSVPSGPDDLARVSQHVYVTEGRPDLYKALRKILGDDGPPSSVHRFFAQLPAKLEERGVHKRYQLIVTTNYDNALERAFDEAQEPFDLAVYLASGEHKGKFLHMPFDGEPHPIMSPNDFAGLPIDDDFDLERTVIVKIHGAVDNAHGPYPWRENYVITEDHYIDYLSRSPVQSLIPVQILGKVRESHCLFLGYTMRDWNLRVFLKRIWGGQALDAKSWAIERSPDVLEKDLWRDFGVDLFAVPLAEYMEELDEHLMARDKE